MEFKDEVVDMGWKKYRVLLGLGVTKPGQIFAGSAMRVPRPNNGLKINDHVRLRNAGRLHESDYVQLGEVELGGTPIDWTMGHLATKHLYVALQPGVSEALRRFSCDGAIWLEFIPWQHAQKVNINMRDGMGIASYPAALLDYDAAMAWYEKATGSKWGER